MDHFSGMPIYEKMGHSTDLEHTVKQLKRWFASFGMSPSIRCDNGPPFFGKGLKKFWGEGVVHGRGLGSLQEHQEQEQIQSKSALFPA